MNKTIFILLCWLLGFVPGMAQQREITAVQHIADSILNRPTRWGNKTKVRTAKTRRVIAASELLNCKQDAFYVCDAGTDGFAIISADERMTPVLGFSQTDAFDAENIPAGMLELLNSYTKEYEALTSGKPQRLTRRHIEGVQEQVGPLLTTEWGQTEPFNNRCPEWNGKRCITGCIAVTSAQTMRYYQYPDSAIGEVDYVTQTNNIPIKENLADFKFDWSSMRNNYNYGGTDKEKNSIADLLYACAVAVKMDFTLEASSASSNNQVKAMVENFGYDPDMAYLHKDYMNTNEWQTLMLNELNCQRPIIYSATSPKEGGHSFIIDGYKADEDAYPYYHINWGWKGYCDNYFKLSSLDADGSEFSQDHEAIIYIQPDNKEQDTGYFLQAQEVILSSVRINPDITHQFTITPKVFNYSYKTFRGHLEFYLKDENEQEILVGTSLKLTGLPFGYGVTNITTKATLPNDIKEGDYTLIIRSKAENSGNSETVTYPSPITITVTTITESYTPDIEILEILNVGEDLEDLSVSLRATWPMNFGGKPFTGTLRMAVADDEGNIITPFGDVANFTNLGQYYYDGRAFTFRGKLPDYLEDGKYRLYIAANQSGYLEWGKVSGYTIQNGGIASNGKELYIPFWLEDGKIIYHKGGEEELPEFYANMQVTDMQVTTFNPETRYIEMQMNNVANLGNEQFIGQFSMVVYDETNILITAFGETLKISTPMGHYQMMSSKTFSFSGNLPEELEDGNYIVKIAAKQSGCRGWSPIKGFVLEDNYITKSNIDLQFDFVIFRSKMYKVDTDGLMIPVGNTKQSNIYDLNGIQWQNANKKGIYIINGKKTVK